MISIMRYAEWLWHQWRKSWRWWWHGKGGGDGDDNVNSDNRGKCNYDNSDYKGDNGGKGENYWKIEVDNDDSDYYNL